MCINLDTSCQHGIKVNVFTLRSHCGFRSIVVRIVMFLYFVLQPMLFLKYEQPWRWWLHIYSQNIKSEDEFELFIMSNTQMFCTFTGMRSFMGHTLLPIDQTRITLINPWTQTLESGTSGSVYGLQLYFRALIRPLDDSHIRTNQGHLYKQGLTYSQHGLVITTIIKCMMKLLLHSQTSTVQPLKSGNGKVISSHI